MKKHERIIEKISTRIVMIIMVLFLLTIIGVAIAIKAGADDLFQLDHDIETEIYPAVEGDSFFVKVYKGYNNAVYAAENYVDAYSKDLLPGRTKMVEGAVRWKNLIGWKLFAPGEYNSILYLDNGYLANANVKESPESIRKISSKIKGLKDYSEESGAEFLYLQTPGNVDKFGDEKINGIKDHANENADLLLDYLKGSGVTCLDLRDLIHEKIPDYHSLFFRTDHHWKQSSALWAAGELSEYLNQNYGKNYDPGLYDPENYQSEIRPEYYLGSLGKRATLAATVPDDFEILTPVFDTDLNFRVAERGIERSGSFPITIDQEEMDDPDIYSRECYLALLSFSASGLSEVMNNQAPNQDHILIVGDSMAIPLTSLLALNCEKCELIDPRYFEGSIREYISLEKPDLVISTYSTTIIQDYYPIFDFE